MFLLETYWSQRFFSRVWYQAYVACSHCLNMMDCLSRRARFYITMILSSLIEWDTLQPTGYSIALTESFYAVNYSGECSMSHPSNSQFSVDFILEFDLVIECNTGINKTHTHTPSDCGNNDRSFYGLFFFVCGWCHLAWNSLGFTPATHGHLIRRGLLSIHVTKA